MQSIERIEAPVLADNGKVRFPRKTLGGRLQPDHVLRTVRFPGDNPIATLPADGYAPRGAGDV